jgi:hypothetical protein
MKVYAGSPISARRYVEARRGRADHYYLAEGTGIARRFIRTDRTGRAAPDLECADLTLDMRTGEDPGAVFDALAARDQIQLHLDEAALQASLAKAAVASFRGGEAVAVVADTREQTASLNAAIRDQLVADQLVDDSRVVTTLAGQRIGGRPDRHPPQRPRPGGRHPGHLDCHRRRPARGSLGHPGPRHPSHRRGSR